MPERAVQYKEFQPCEALRPYIRAFFTFTASPVRSAPGDWSRLFADGHVSIVFSFGAGYAVDELWNGSAPGHVIGPVSRAHSSRSGTDLIQVGAYCRAGAASALTGVPPFELADRVVALGDLWGGACAGELEARLFDARDERRRVALLETALISRITKADDHYALNIPALAQQITAQGGQAKLPTLAEQAGVSRQYLTREFRRRVGVTPKLYSRLARFRASLRYVRLRRAGWAEAALDCGYADQSHMISEFREFSGRTPEQLLRTAEFHPFMETTGER